jgi:hypothetical protein
LNGATAQVIRTVTNNPTVGTPTAIQIVFGTEPTCQIVGSSTTNTYATSATNSTGINWTLSNTSAGTISSAGVLTWANGFSGTVFVQATASGCNGPSAIVSRAVTINPPFTPTVSITPSSTICAGGSVTLAASGLNTLGSINDGDFNQANPDGWQVRENGTIINFPANANNTNTNPWSGTNDRSFNNIYYNSQLGGKFAIVNGAVISTLESPIFNTVGGTTGLALNFFQAYNLNSGTVAKIEISTDGGSTYAATLTQYSPGNFGTPNGNFTNVNIPLSSYLGMTNLRIRFSYTGTAGSNWALDNVKIAEAYLPVSYAWSTGSGTAGSGQTIVVSPTQTTTYNLNSTMGGCTTTIQSVTVTVNPVPVIGDFTTSQCDQRPFTINPPGTVVPAGTTYTWSTPSYSSSSITGGSASSGSPASFTQRLSNSSLNPGTATYTIIPTSGSCSGSSFKIIVSVTGNTWTGITNTDWSVPSNWCSNLVPTSLTDAIIPVVPNQPKLTAPSSEVRTMVMHPGTTLTMDGKLFSIYGNLPGTGVLIGSSQSQLVLNGTLTTGNLYFSQATDSITNVLKDLTVNTTGTFTVADTLYILNELASNAGTLNANGKLTLRSTSEAATARVAPLTGTINGDVTVERFIPARRAYRFLSPSVTTTTNINANWMEGQTSPYVFESNVNLKPGYGTHITGAGGVSVGFDWTQTSNPSIFTFNKDTQRWDTVFNSFATLKAGVPYRVMVRGSRSVDLNNNEATPSNTIIRAKGILHKGQLCSRIGYPGQRLYFSW